jgi:signal transduction histidine kinase
LGDSDSTYWYHDHYSVLRDSVFSEDMGVRLAEMETRFGMEKKEREINAQRADIAAKNLAIAELDRQAERRKFLLALATSGIGVLIASALLFFQVQRRRASAIQAAAVIAEREQGLKALVESTDAERARIASELHDGVGQLLTGLKFRAEAAATTDPQLKDLLSLADEAGREVRGIAHRMMPRALSDLGLLPALSDMLDRSLKLPGMQHTFEHFGLEERLLPHVETGVYRIAQELVNNVLKHAKARHVHVELLKNKGHLVLILEDDGVGIDLARKAHGLGMRSLQDRARTLQGSLDIERGTEQGTVATLRIPLTNGNA